MRISLSCPAHGSAVTNRSRNSCAKRDSTRTKGSYASLGFERAVSSHRAPREVDGEKEREPKAGNDRPRKEGEEGRKHLS